MELTDNDKNRIEQEAIVYTEGHGSTHKNWRGFLKGAEYATLYERQECDKIIERATSDGMDTIVMLDQKVKQLEAERSELSKRIEELEAKNKNQAELIERCIHPDRLPDHVKKLEGLLHKILKESVGGNVPFSFELYSEIKAALNL